MLATLFSWLLRLYRWFAGPHAQELQAPRRPAPPKRVVPEVTATPEPDDEPVAEAQDDRVYAAKEFDCAAIREKATAFLGTDGISEQQLGMVFAEAGAQAVAAGAGSGKSSTLVRRLLVMREHLEVELKEITVITFTRNSCNDFREKLVKTSKALGAPITQAQAKAHVRTFHSKLLRLTSSVQPGGTDIFEWLDKARRPPAGSPEEKDFERRREQLADQVDNPYDNKLSDSQADVLRSVYVEAYRVDEQFREAVKALFQHSLRDSLRQQGSWVDDDWEKRQWAHDRDEALTEYVKEHWVRAGRWPITGVVTPPPALLEVEQLRFRAHGYLPIAEVFVVLGGNDLPRDNQYKNGKKLKPYYSSRSKRNVLLRGCREAMFFVRTPADLEQLKAAIEAEDAIVKDTAPVFRCRLPGEGGGAEPIAEALYNLGTFMENLGLRPAVDAIPLSQRMTTGLEALTLYAVGRFFQSFEQYKQANYICTFNDLFFMLQEGSRSLRSIPLDHLKSLKHLLIDEFQDISPLVVGMIKGLHGELVRRQGPEQGRPTLLVVGDDWQSIYGWRGSAPRFFIEFSRNFSGAADQPIRLTDNWRSTQHIVECAATALKNVSHKHKVDKVCRAVGKVAALPNRVLMVEEELTDEEIGEVVRALADLRTGDEELHILSRTNKGLEVADNALPRRRSDKIKLMTVYKSKGLEADYVLVLEDFVYANSNRIKNALYKRAKFSQSFDESQRDEMCRLAYVALTRAKKLCVWMAEPSDGGVMRSVPSSEHCKRIDVEKLLAKLAELRAPPNERAG